MYRSVKKSAGTQSYPSHPRWDIKGPDGACIATTHNIAHARKIVRLLNERIATIHNIIHADKIVRLLNGQDRDIVEITNSVESIVIPKGAN